MISTRLWRIVVLSALLSLGLVLATPLPPVSALEPCCSIVAIDQAKGQVTAREAGTKRTFQFQVDDKALLATLRIGQKIYADFGTQKVSVDGVEPCCNIVQAKGPGGGSKPGAAKIPAAKMPTVMGATPCCGIVAVDQAKGLVTLRDLKTGQTFQVAVKDAARLKSLKIGQAVDRNIGTPVR
jgi:Cu/Ag efflux protein CusF